MFKSVSEYYQDIATLQTLVIHPASQQLHSGRLAQVAFQYINHTYTRGSPAAVHYCGRSVSSVMACVIAQQYSSAILVASAPSFPQGEIMCGFKIVIISFLLYCFKFSSLKIRNAFLDFLHTSSLKFLPRIAPAYCDK
jgi:hypothetical protein